MNCYNNYQLVIKNEMKMTRQADACTTFSTDLHHMHHQTTVATKLCHELASSLRNRPHTPIIDTLKSTSLVLASAAHILKLERKSTSLVWHHASKTEFPLVLLYIEGKITSSRKSGASVWKVYLHGYLLGGRLFNCVISFYLPKPLTHLVF